jgi:hypothetical protein
MTLTELLKYFVVPINDDDTLSVNIMSSTVHRIFFTPRSAVSIQSGHDVVRDAVARIWNMAEEGKSDERRAVGYRNVGDDYEAWGEAW